METTNSFLRTWDQNGHALWSIVYVHWVLAIAASLFAAETSETVSNIWSSDVKISENVRRFDHPISPGDPSVQLWDWKHWWQRMWQRQYECTQQQVLSQFNPKLSFPGDTGEVMLYWFTTWQLKLKTSLNSVHQPPTVCCICIFGCIALLLSEYRKGFLPRRDCGYLTFRVFMRCGCPRERWLKVDLFPARMVEELWARWSNKSAVRLRFSGIRQAISPAYHDNITIDSDSVHKLQFWISFIGISAFSAVGSRLCHFCAESLFSKLFSRDISESGMRSNLALLLRNCVDNGTVSSISAEHSVRSVFQMWALAKILAVRGLREILTQTGALQVCDVSTIKIRLYPIWNVPFFWKIPPDAQFRVICCFWVTAWLSP
jgi:hypothetical protein